MKKLLTSLLASLCVFVAHSENLTLTWDLSINAAGYNLYESVNSGPYGPVATPSSPPVTVVVNAPNSYRFYVTAFNSAGESGPSDVLLYTPAAGTPNLVFSAPVMPATVTQGQTVTITATVRNTGTADYNITSGSLTLLQPGATRADGPYQWATPAVVPQVLHPGTTLSYSGTFTADNNSLTGIWNAYLVVTDGSGVWSPGPFTSFTVVSPAPQPPAPPTNLRVTGTTTSRIDLRWDAGGNAGDTVSVYWADVTMNFALADTVNYPVSTYTKSGLKRNRLYYFRALRKNSAGTSGYSNTVSGHTRR